MTNENGEEPSKVQMYVVTRKRKDGRNYKSSNDVINYKISTVQQMCSNGTNSETVEQLVSGDFVGRCALPKKKKTESVQSTSQAINVETLTSQIEEKLKVQMEEAVNKKVKENMAMLMKQLVEAYPNLSINMEDAFEVPSENGDNESSKDA